jgi:hypothetical protein
MAITAFPAVKPSSRTWMPGSQPSAAFNTLSGYESRVLLGSQPIGTQLQLTFNNQTEEIVLGFTEHFAKAKGTYETFDVPNDVFAGMTNYGAVTPEGQTWRYNAAPQVVWVSPGIANVQIRLVAIHS